MFKILIINEDPIIRVILKKTLENQGYDVAVATNGEEGITKAQQLHPALIICDWMMSRLSGLEVCRQIKAKPELSTAFFILLTTRGNVVDRVVGLDAGADEFLSKPLELNELKARVRAALRLYQLNQELQIQKQALAAELVEVSEFVRSLLPQPLVGTVTTEAVFTSAQLGGDCFDYYWLDRENLAIYLLDISGHGVGSALLSVSVLNVLRSQSLPNTNFYQPSTVLISLNNYFQMSNHGDKYFTIWYGVYNISKRQLIHANAGHPPGVLLSRAPTQLRKLSSPGLPIGFFPDADFEDNYCDVEENSTLYLFSDGIYEIHLSDGEILGLDAFIDLLADSSKVDTYSLEKILMQIMALSVKQPLEDDLSLLKVTFG